MVQFLLLWFCASLSTWARLSFSLSFVHVRTRNTQPFVNVCVTHLYLIYSLVSVWIYFIFPLPPTKLDVRTNERTSQQTKTTRSKLKCEEQRQNEKANNNNSYNYSARTHIQAIAHVYTIHTRTITLMNTFLWLCLDYTYFIYVNVCVRVNFSSPNTIAVCSAIFLWLALIFREMIWNSWTEMENSQNLSHKISNANSILN